MALIDLTYDLIRNQHHLINTSKEPCALICWICDIADLIYKAKTNFYPVGGDGAPELEETLKNFAINSAAVTVLGIILNRDLKKQRADKSVIEREESLSRLQVVLSSHIINNQIIFSSLVSLSRMFNFIPKRHCQLEQWVVMTSFCLDNRPEINVQAHPLLWNEVSLL